MKNKNPQIAAKTIQRTEETMQASLREPERRRSERKHFASVAERVAQSSVCMRNWRFKGANEAFPSEPTMRFVDQYYPYAVGGELLVDVPVTPGDKLECARKAAVLAKLGYRYLIIEKEMDEFDALERLKG